MQTIQGQVVVIDPNTPNMKLLFNGVVVEGVVDLRIDWDELTPKMTVTLNETEQVAAMKAANINVRRAA